MSLPEVPIPPCVTCGKPATIKILGGDTFVCASCLAKGPAHES